MCSMLRNFLFHGPYLENMAQTDIFRIKWNVRSNEDKEFFLGVGFRSSWESSPRT